MEGKNEHWFKYGWLVNGECPIPESQQSNESEETTSNAKKCLDRYQLKNNIDLKETSGGGLIGSFAYQLTNTSNIDEAGDGYHKVNRRWSSRLFKDVLCRNLPLIQDNDIEFPYPSASSNPPGFRWPGSPCITCHTSMDFAARVNRNTVFSPIGMSELHGQISLIHDQSTKIFE